jgi:hypothetical protein
MNVDVTSRTVIARSRPAVAAFAMDPDNAPKWYVNIKSVEWKTAPPPRAGSCVAFVAHFLGRRLAYTYEFTVYEPGSKLVMRTTEGPFAMETTYTFEDAPDGATAMALRNRGTPSGFAAIIAPFAAVAMRRANRKDLARLKQLMEA